MLSHPEPGAPVVLFITAASQDEARSIARALLEARLIACANLLPGIESYFWWKGSLDQAAEVMIIAKTTADRVDAATAVVRRIHSYEVFGLVTIPIAAGNPDYLHWIEEEASGRAD